MSRRGDCHIGFPPVLDVLAVVRGLPAPSGFGIERAIHHLRAGNLSLCEAVLSEFFVDPVSSDERFCCWYLLGSAHYRKSVMLQFAWRREQGAEARRAERLLLRAAKTKESSDAWLMLAFCRLRLLYFCHFYASKLNRTKLAEGCAEAFGEARALNPTYTPERFNLSLAAILSDG